MIAGSQRDAGQPSAAAARLAQAGARPLILDARGLTKIFPGVVALDEVDFDLREGEVHALLGANGAGKSTLIKILAGLYAPDGGSLRLGGEPAEIGDTRHARELGISVIYQEFALVPQLSVAENIFLGQERLGSAGLVDWPGTYDQAEILLRKVGANFSARIRVRDLGTGQRQLVEIAKALSMKARVLILDEPTAALSRGEAERLFGLVRELAASGVGIIYVSHRLEEIAGLVNRVTVLRDGRSMGTFPASALDRRKIVGLITGHDTPAGKRSQRPDREPGEEILTLRNLSRPGEYEDICLSVRRGEIAVITGLLGAGRTELLETVFGVRAAKAGEIRVLGRSARFRGPDEAIAAGIALVPEDRRGQGLIEGLAVFKNISLASLADFVGGLGLRLRDEIARAGEVIRDLSIRTPSPTTPARFLSGGNQQKVVIGKWMLTSAELILFDEPTQGLDVGAKDEIYALMDRLAEKGKAILVVSSDMAEVLEIADRVIAMRHGRIVGEFRGDAIRTAVIMSAITLGETE